MSAGDAVVVGGGANGLATAALLARAGRRVTVLERRPILGGLAAGEEFHPGYRSAGLLHDTTGLAPGVVAALDLARHGLRLRSSRPALLALGRPGEGLLLDADPAVAAREIAVRSAADAERYVAWRAFLDRARPLFARWIERPALDLVGLDGTRDLVGLALALRRGGRKQMHDLLRVPPMPAADWLGEWFTDDLLKAALALPAVRGTFCGPRAPGSAFNLLRHDTASGPGVEGGAVALVAALVAAARALGVELRCGAEVTRIFVEAGRVTGVELDGGEVLVAPIVAASCDPRRTFLAWLPPGAIPARTVRRIEGYRMRGTLARVSLALDRAPEFACRPGQAIEVARTGASLDDLERAYDAVKYREISAAPVLEIHVATAERPDLAPAGHAVLSILVHCAPYDLAGGWDAARRAALGDLVVEIVERHAPGTQRAVVGREVLAPPDIEARYGLSGGHLDHGENGLDQLLVRPAPECVHHATPVRGLFLCGAGTHPGGGLTCRPASLAAAAILRTA